MEKFSLVQLLDPQLAEINEAAGIVALQGDGAFAEAFCLFLVILGLGPFVDDLAIDGHGDLLALDLDVVGEPFVILVAGLLEVLDAVDAAGFTPILLGGIDLAFVTVRGPAFVLELGVNENTGIRSLGGFAFAFKLEVLKLGIAVLAVEEVGSGTLDLNGAFFNGEGGGVLGIDLPTLEGLSVEHVDPLSGKGE